jgi:hypothetical protein
MLPCYIRRERQNMLTLQQPKPKQQQKQTNLRRKEQEQNYNAIQPESVGLVHSGSHLS